MQLIILNKIIMNTIIKISLLTFTIVLIIIIILVLVLWLNSPGKPEQFLDRNGNKIPNSISEKIFIQIGGIKQGMFIKSKNLNDPVLLYLHGGIPDYFLNQKYPTMLEDYFTVVWWEQRGSGLSYNPNITKETISLNQMIADVKELTNYLRNRFGQEKIYIMGRSGGTFLGIYAIASAPELYHAYIGVGQMSDQLQSERLAYEYMLNKYKETKNRKMQQKLEASPVTVDIPFGYLKQRDHAMHSLGIGTTRNMKSVITGLFFPSLACREYTLREKFNLWRSKTQWGVHPLWDTVITTDLAQQVNEIVVPVYFFHGIYDYTVSYTLAKKYFDAIYAPLKGFYTFGNSAHSPIFEEPLRVREIIEKDVLKKRTDLADNIN